MTLPNFLIIGAMKGGTTSLYQYLADHPEVFMASPKELHFFNHRGGEDLAWYEEHFANGGTAIALGEASASYTTYPEASGVPSRIAQVIPEVRLIYLVRNPIERMRSHYVQRLSGGDETATIDRALLSEPVYLESSRYAQQVERYLDHFTRDQMLILKSEDLRDDRRATMRTVFAFLGVDSSYWEPSVMEREFYRTSEKRIPRPMVRAIRRVPWGRRLIHRAPTSVRKMSGRLVSETPREGQAVVSMETRAKVEELLRDDVRHLRQYMRAGFDGWGIA
ncbi:MAG: sulfotransferase family protein [Actinomycetota bacterium]